jgi:hypothetical protein
VALSCFHRSLRTSTHAYTCQARDTAPKDPRLFVVSNATGSLRVDEVADFSQVRM